MLAKTCKQGGLTLITEGDPVKKPRSFRMVFMVSDDDGTIVEFKLEERQISRLLSHEFEVPVDFVFYDEHPYWKGKRDD